MFAIRAPFALVVGTLISVALFLALVATRQRAVRCAASHRRVSYDFTPQIRDTPDREQARSARSSATPPPEIVIVDGPGWTNTGVTTVGGSDAPAVDHRPAPAAAACPSAPTATCCRSCASIPTIRRGAITSGTEGWVQVQFSVTATGTVRDAVVVASEPGTIFDEAALKAIARWRYNPRVESGVAVERVGLQTIIRFELEN